MIQVGPAGAGNLWMIVDFRVEAAWRPRSGKRCLGAPTILRAYFCLIFIFHLDSLCPTPLGRVDGMLKYNNNINGDARRAKP